MARKKSLCRVDLETLSRVTGAQSADSVVAQNTPYYVTSGGGLGVAVAEWRNHKAAARVAAAGGQASRLSKWAKWGRRFSLPGLAMFGAEVLNAYTNDPNP